MRQETATPPVSQEQHIPEWAPPEVPEFVPQSFDGIHMVRQMSSYMLSLPVFSQTIVSAFQNPDIEDPCWSPTVYRLYSALLFDSV